MNTLQELQEQLEHMDGKPFLLKLGKRGIQVYRYAELSEASRHLAWGLTLNGVQPGDVVGFFAPLGFAWTAACLGALQAGAVVMPLDLQLEEEALARILEDSAPACVFADTSRAERLRGAGEGRLPVYLLDGAGAGSWEDLLSPDARDLPGISPDHRACLFYTSGTTGPPKGVPLSHGNLAFQIDTVRRTGLINPDDRVLLPLPPHHVYPFVIGVLVPLSLGITVVLPHSLTGPQMVRALREGGITLLLGVPRLYDALFEGIASRFDSNRAVRRLFDKGLRAQVRLQRKTGLGAGTWLLRLLRRKFAPKLRILASGGAALDPALALKLEALGWQVAIGYGLTETSPLLTIKLPGDPCHESVGRPVSGVRIRIDHQALPDSDAPRSSHREGEILAKGPNVFSGYHNMPEKTAAVFTRDGWFRTGDLGYFDPEGYLHVTGRVSTLIVTKSGENIQPDDVETHLSTHALIREAGVLQLEDGALAAVIVPETKHIREKSIQGLNSAMQDAIDERSKDLPSYQHINDFAVTRTPLPRTRLGKIRRHLLADVFQRAKADQGDQGPSGSGPIPVSEMSPQDRAILENPAARETWKWLAERYRDRFLSPDTRPGLELGIDSMEWLNISLEIRRRTGVELEEKTIGEISTVRGLLEGVARESGAGETKPLGSPLEEPEKMLTPAQRHWLEPLSPIEKKAVKGLYALNLIIFKRIFGIRFQGLENLPDRGPFVITPNHVSHLDPFALAVGLGLQRLDHVFWAMLAKIAFRNSFFRYFSRLFRTVPVDPEKGMISTIAFGAAVLDRDKGLVWFPEGTRSWDGRLQPFKAGVGALLEHYNVPVIPTFVRGTETVLPRGKAIPRFNPVSVVFGSPLYAEDLVRNGEGEDKMERIATALHKEVARLGEGLESGQTV